MVKQVILVVEAQSSGHWLYRQEAESGQGSLDKYTVPKLQPYDQLSTLATFQPDLGKKNQKWHSRGCLCCCGWMRVGIRTKCMSSLIKHFSNTLKKWWDDGQVQKPRPTLQRRQQHMVPAAQLSGWERDSEATSQRSARGRLGSAAIRANLSWPSNLVTGIAETAIHSFGSWGQWQREMPVLFFVTLCGM